MSHHLHMSNWMAVGTNQKKKDKSVTRLTAKKTSCKMDAYKTVMCQAWLECKMCPFAENCRFAHGEAELRPAKIAPTLNSKYKTKLCDKYTTTGLCPYGRQCLFIHPEIGSNDYIRPDKMLEVSQRHAMVDLDAFKSVNNIPRPVTPEFSLETFFGKTSAGQRPQPSWPLDPEYFNDEPEPNRKQAPKSYDLFGCFDSASTPNRVSLASGISGYVSGASSPYSTLGSSANMNVSDDEQLDRDFFRITGLDHLAEEMTRNLTSTDRW